jgi:hypothetical protein
MRESPENRRRALQGLVALGGIASVQHWAKPVVTSIVLPAHARSSLMLMSGNFYGTGPLSVPPPP